ERALDDHVAVLLPITRRVGYVPSRAPVRVVVRARIVVPVKGIAMSERIASTQGIGIAGADAARDVQVRCRRAIVLTLVDRDQAINQDRIDVRVDKLLAQLVLLEHLLVADDRIRFDGIDALCLERARRLLLERAVLRVRIEKRDHRDAPEWAAVERWI